MQMLQQYQQFKQQMKNKDPRALLDQMIRSGRVSQDDIKNAENMARMFRNLLK